MTFRKERRFALCSPYWFT